METASGRHVHCWFAKPTGRHFKKARSGSIVETQRDLLRESFVCRVGVCGLCWWKGRWEEGGEVWTPGHVLFSRWSDVWATKNYTSKGQITQHSGAHKSATCFHPGFCFDFFQRVAMTVSDNPTASTYENQCFSYIRICLFFPQNSPNLPTAASSIRVQGAASLLPCTVADSQRMLRDTNVIWWSQHGARCVLPRRPSFRWRSTEYKPWLFGETDVGPDCRSLKPYWVSAKRLTPSISHHRSSQLSLPSGLISSPGRDQYSSIHCTLKRARESLLKINR